MLKTTQNKYFPNNNKDKGSELETMISFLLICFVDDLGSKAFETTFNGYLSHRYQGVEFFLCIFLFISLTWDSNSNPPWDTSDALAPYLLVQLHVNTNVICTHCFLGKFADLFDCLRSLLLESAGLIDKIT